MQQQGDLNLIHQGRVSEQVVGQLLRTIEPYYTEPALFYWTRQQAGSNAEIDYILQVQDQVIPIEVKSGSTGAMKSLQFFMREKDYQKAVRINSDLPSKVSVDLQTPQQQPVRYELLSLPFYLIGQLYRLIGEAF